MVQGGPLQVGQPSSIPGGGCLSGASSVVFLSFHLHERHPKKPPNLLPSFSPAVICSPSALPFSHCGTLNRRVAQLGVRRPKEMASLFCPLQPQLPRTRHPAPRSHYGYLRGWKPPGLPAGRGRLGKATGNHKAARWPGPIQ